MISTALHVLPVLGAATEKSRTAFYICGGALAAWAVIVSVGLGLRRPRFPYSPRGQRAVMATSAVLVVATATAAVATAGPPAQATATSPGGTTNIRAGAVLGTPSTTDSIEANPTGMLAFSTKTLTAKAGIVKFNMTNLSPLEHNFTVAHGTQVLGATPTFKGGTRTVEIDLKPGVYVFYCSVPGHRQAGMEGTLKVS